MAYQHKGPYLEGDRVWYQMKDGKYWCGHAVVHCHKERSELICSMRGMKKVVVVKAKPYEWVERDQGDSNRDKKDQGEN